MPTVEDYFDDDTDLPLPSSSSSSIRQNIPNSGLKGALLDEITSEDEVENDMDFSKLADQSRGVFGENSQAPPRGSSGGEGHSNNGKGKIAVRENDGELRPSGPPSQAQGINPNTPMGGFMGDMMKLQQVEEERMMKLRKQMGNTTLTDPSVYKACVLCPFPCSPQVGLND